MSRTKNAVGRECECGDTLTEEDRKNRNIVFVSQEASDALCLDTGTPLHRDCYKGMLPDWWGRRHAERRL